MSKKKIATILAAIAAVGVVIMGAVEALQKVFSEAPVDPAAADSTTVAILHVLGLG